MKRAGNLIPAIAASENLQLAAWKAAKGKRHQAEVMQWFEQMDHHLMALQNQILSGRVVVGNYRYFKVFEPKERQICASAFGEQVLHHALMNICHPFFENTQDFDSYASRKGKGTYAALDRAKIYTARATWYLKMDVRKFFESIHHDVILQQLSAMFKDDTLLSIFEQIVRSYEASPNRGLPIGNLTSQYFANHYLSGLDKWIKVQLKAKCYVRYMDDMVIWHSQIEVLKAFNVQISAYLKQQLLCTLKPVALNRCSSGLPFLGYHIFPNYLHLLQKSKQRFIRKLKIVDDAFHEGRWSAAKCNRRATPLLSFIAHADTKKFQTEAFFRLQ